jgi:hypothetical protein
MEHSNSLNKTDPFVRALGCLLFFALLQFSCTSDNAANPSELSVTIIPLKSGNTWIRAQTYYDSMQTVLRTAAVTERIYADTLIGGERWYAITPTFDFIVTNRTDGHYVSIRREGGSTYSTELLWKYPAMPGETITTRTFSSTVVSTTDLITTAAGTFECYHYRSNYTNPAGDMVTGYSSSWLCPKIGIVKMEGYLKKPDGDDYLYYKEELTSYSLK